MMDVENMNNPEKLFWMEYERVSSRRLWQSMKMMMDLQVINCVVFLMSLWLGRTCMVCSSNSSSGYFLFSVFT